MKISEVSEKYDIPPDTLRYYEKVGLLPDVKKNAGGIRDYSELDCKWVEFIKCMRGAGLPVDVLFQYISLFNQGDHTCEARRTLLIEERKKLIAKRDAIQVSIEKLDYKINVYYKTLCEKEKALLET